MMIKQLLIAKYANCMRIIYMNAHVGIIHNYVIFIQPVQSKTPTDTKHYYWRASKILSSEGGDDHVQLLSSHNNDVLTFSNDTALMFTSQ